MYKGQGDINMDALDKLAADLEGQGVTALARRCDVSSEADCKAMVDTAVEQFGRLDMAVNNAGIAHGFIPIHELTGELLDQQMNVNVKGVMFGMKHQIPAMKASGGGAIVNTASINGLSPGNMQGIYSISKAAVISMTKSFAMECAEFNVRVNALLPGLTKTKFAGALFQQEEIYKSAIAQIPMHRHAEPKEMAGTVLYLVSDASSYVTGECVVVDGGFTI